MLLTTLGIGRNTSVMIDLAEACGHEIGELYHYNDERTGELCCGRRIAGSFADIFSRDITGQAFLLTMGDSGIRSQLTKRILSAGGSVPTLIHPSAVVSRYAEVSPVGVSVAPFVHINSDSVIEEGVQILSGAQISHTNRLGRYAFIAERAVVGAYVRLGEHVFVGQGAVLASQKVGHVGDGAVIGAGAVVVKDVEQGAVMAGCPARKLYLVQR